MTTLLQASGRWNVTPTVVAKGTWTVVASAPDPAGNIGRARQVLTIAAEPSPGPDGGSFNAVGGTTVTPDGTQKVKGLSLAIGTKVTAPAGGRVVATANGIVTIEGVRKAIRLTTVTTALAAGQSTSLKLVPNGTRKTARAALRKVKSAVKAGKQVTARIRVKIVDAAGHVRAVTRTVTLT
jgi:hypothetical protein